MPRSMWILLVNPLPQYRLVVRVKSKRGIPGAPDACVLALPYGSTVWNAPLPFPFTLFGLYPGYHHQGERGVGVTM